MKNRILLFVSAFAAVFASVFFYAHSVSADYGLSATAGAAGLSQEKDVAGIIGNVIGAGLSLVTVLFFILMIYGGIRWMMARGKEEESKKALDTIIAAIIGIIIVLASYAITNFVFKSVGSAAGNGGGGGGGDTPPTVTTCSTKFASEGLTCQEKTKCNKAKANDVQVSHDKVEEAGGLDSKIQLGTDTAGTGGNGSYYIVNACEKQPADVVCCAS